MQISMRLAASLLLSATQLAARFFIFIFLLSDNHAHKN
jgi:hypothetical protein